MREEARAAGKPPRYNGMWRDRDPSEAPAGVTPVIRIKAPLTGEIVVNDHVQGKVVFKAENLDDFIILRSDGTPTYMLAVVVDDHDMGVTHIIRGDDHLTNAARQIIIYNGMGWDSAGDGAHPADPRAGRRQAEQAPRRARASAPTARWATCPEAMINYLARLGWSHGDDELFSIRADGRVVLARGPQQGRGALRLRQAREHQRPLHPRRKPERLYKVMVETAAGGRPRRRCRRASPPTTTPCSPPCPSCSRAPRPCSS